MKRPFETFENKTSQYFQNLYNLYLSLQAATRKPLVMIAEKIPVLSLDLLKGLPPIATGIKNATPPALPAPSQESFSFKFQTPQKAQNPLKIASQPKAPPQQKSLPLDLGISWGKTSPIPPPPPPKVSNPKKAEKFPWPKRVMVNYMWGNQAEKRIPLSSNYSTFDVLFAPDYRPGHFLTFYDFRVHYIDTSTFSGNVGVGTRFIPKGERLCQMLGFNCYYDWRQGGLGYFQQLSFGVEVIGRRWDLRANAYVPIGKRPRICSCTFDEFIGDYFAIRHDIESISNSYNAEVGYLMVNGKDFSLYAATGPYFLTRAKYVSNTIGVEARIQPKFKDYLTLNLVGRYDRLFGRVFQAELSLSLPLYELRKRDLRPCGLRNWQIFQPVQRFEVMPLNQKSCWETNF